MSDFDWDKYAGDRFSFVNVGDLAWGRIEKIEDRSGVHGDCAVLTLVIDKTGATRELWAGPANMRQQLTDLRPQAGDVLRVELVGEQHTGQPSPMKLFKVDVKRADPAAPPEPVVVVPEVDLEAPF